MKTRFYYSLTDLNSIVTGIDEGCFYTETTQAGSQIGFFRFLSRVLPVSLGRQADTEQTLELFQNYVWPRFYDEAFGYIDVEHDPWIEPTKPSTAATVLPKFEWKLGQVWSWLHESAKRYTALIGYYEGQEDELMKQLSSKATTLFNDTPQAGGDVTTSSYITNATTATTVADVGTPMARLKEIRENLEDLYKSWAEEFRKFIIM